MPRVRLQTVLREWGRIGVIGFGGPPAHIALLRELVVERRGWIAARDFEDATAAITSVSSRPGTMNASPPASAPPLPATRRAQ